MENIILVGLTFTDSTEPWGEHTISLIICESIEQAHIKGKAHCLTSEEYNYYIISIPISEMKEGVDVMKYKI